MQKLLMWFDETIRASQEKQKMLLDDQRKDEAVFEKVQENVYDIFRTVLNVAIRQHGQDTQAVRSFFMARLAQIPVAWEQSLQLAQQHGNYEKAHTEQIKLQALAKIKAAAEEMQ